MQNCSMSPNHGLEEDGALIILLVCVGDSAETGRQTINGSSLATASRQPFMVLTHGC